MNFKKEYLYYVLGVVGVIVVFGIGQLYFYVLLAGFGVGYLLHDWIKGMYDNSINVFFTGEVRKRSMKRKELEQELEKLNSSD
jgi:hypothetical protein